MTDKIENQEYSALEDILLEFPVTVMSKNGLPAVQIRWLTTNADTVKKILSCAYHNQPVTIMLTFTKKLESINSMLRLGIIYYNKNDKLYHFTI